MKTGKEDHVVQPKFSRAKIACYLGSVTMSAVSNLSPILFITFHEIYGISYTLLGLLAAFCFGVQLGIDLIFSFFAKHFDIHKTVRLTPAVAVVGFIVYAAMPPLFPDFVYLWLVIGTLLFSVAAGLCEVLLSPVIAAIPAENPEHEMAKLHSAYAWGTVAVVIVSTLLLKLFTPARWYLVAGLLALIPLIDFVLFSRAELPPVPVNAAGGKRGIPKGLGLCVCFIIICGVSELTMNQWCSSFLERAVGLPKALGDIFGLALFAALMGTGRTLYAKRGKNIYRTLYIGVLGAFFCYLVAAISPLPIISLAACVLTGFFVAMLWPGTLIFMEEKYPNPGVVAFALMAAGGDAGASLGPQMVGAVVDGFLANEWAQSLAVRLSLTPEQLGMKAAMLIAALFPLIGILLLTYMKHFYAKREKEFPKI